MTGPRRRSAASARAAGKALERLVADYLAEHIDDRIDVRKAGAAKDRGDIGGIRIHGGQHVVVEAKNTAHWSPGPWLGEAEIERGNDDALAGVVVAKRHGKGRAEDQVVLMTLRDFTALLTGHRPEEEA